MTLRQWHIWWYGGKVRPIYNATGYEEWFQHAYCPGQRLIHFDDFGVADDGV